MFLRVRIVQVKPQALLATSSVTRLFMNLEGMIAKLREGRKSKCCPGKSIRSPQIHRDITFERPHAPENPGRERRVNKGFVHGEDDAGAYA